MRFKLWLEDIDDYRNAHSWLDTHGHFHHVEPMVTHGDWAFKKGYGNLYIEGWMRVQSHNYDLFVSNSVYRPNHLQKAAIIDFAIASRKFNRVVYDNGNQDIVLWDRLEDV